MRCDCTGDPPGELMLIAIAGAVFTAKAFFRSGATLASVSPDWKRDTRPIVPERRTTGTIGA